MGSHLAQIHFEELHRSRLQRLAHGVLILGAMILLLGSVGWLLGGPGGVLILLGSGLALALFNPRVSGSLVLRMQGAVPLTRATAPHLSHVMDILSERAGLEHRPRLYRVPGGAVTAFSVGSREDPGIGVSDGLLRALSFRELVGVLAHEVSHIERNDTRVLGLAALLAQATRTMSLVGQVLVFLNIPLLLMGRVTISWMAILLLVLAPGLSGILQLALSRTREYDADLGAVRLTGDPRGLASALHRLEELNRGLLGHLFPGAGRIPVPAFLRTHPETEERIRRLLRLEKGPMVATLSLPFTPGPPQPLHHYLVEGLLLFGGQHVLDPHEELQVNALDLGLQLQHLVEDGPGPFHVDPLCLDVRHQCLHPLLQLPVELGGSLVELPRQIVDRGLLLLGQRQEALGFPDDAGRIEVWGKEYLEPFRLALQHRRQQECHAKGQQGLFHRYSSNPLVSAC